MQKTGLPPLCSASCNSRWRKAMNPAAVSVPVRTENRRAPCALIAEIRFRPNRAPGGRARGRARETGLGAARGGGGAPRGGGGRGAGGGGGGGPPPPPPLWKKPPP